MKSIFHPSSWDLERLKLDRGILLCVLFLMGLGLVQIYSSSYILATENFQDGFMYFRKQLLFSFIGLTVLFSFALMPTKFLLRWGWVIWIVAIIGVIMTYVPGLSVKAGGAHRWIRLPGDLRFEPTELLRVTFPFILSFWVKRFAEGKWGLATWWAQLFFMMGALVLVLKQPDFGTVVISTVLIMSLLFVYGLPWRMIAIMLVCAIPVFYVLVMREGYRRARLEAFLDPWSDPGEKGFQVIQSLLSFFSGGFSGVGLGQGQGKLFFLPEAHTDFTLSVLAEETGFIGFFMIMMVYGFLIFRGFQIALRAKKNQTESQVVALGLTVVLALSVLINVGVVLGMLPTKGLTLPFLSYGGSSLLSMCMAFGCLLNIERGQRLATT